MPKSFRNSFTSGYLDPLVASRSDLEQYPKGLRQGVNIILDPHGGFSRRPGTRFARKLAGLGSPENPGRLARFQFNDEQHYLLHFRNNRLDIYQGDNRITRIVTPYGNSDLAGLYLSPKAQTADTRIVCAEAPDGTTDFTDYAPRRLLRSPLTNPNAIKTSVTSTIVRVYQRDHRMLDGDTIGLSGLEDVGGIVADRLNDAQTVRTFEDGKHGAASLGANPLTYNLDGTVSIELGFAHGLITGDRLRLFGLAAFGGIPGEQINRIQTLSAAGPGSTKVYFDVESVGETAATGGGSAGHWRAENFYDIDVGGSTTGITADSGGGTAGRAWLFHSLAPDEQRNIKFSHIPQFDYEDSASPDPRNAIQKLTFDGFAEGDSYSLKISVPAQLGFGAYTIRTGNIEWTTGDIADNATRMLDAINAGAQGFNDQIENPNILDVTYEGDGAGDPSPVAPPYVFFLRYTTANTYALVVIGKVESANGTLVAEEVVAGGSTEEDVMSNTRGWPGACIFYQRRLWLYDIFNRPSTLLSSRIEDFFNLSTGSALDGDAIDATGEFDRIRHLVAERGLFMLTANSEVPILGGAEDEAITPTNINLKVSSRFGSSRVVPVSVAGRPIYCDRIGRAIRQLGQGDNGIESSDISILSQSLIRDPVQMELWRNPLGDYVCVVNDDGTMAVLCINQDQGVAGWVLWTTDGDFLDACQVGDDLYVIVSRTVDSETVYYLEAFDFNLFTDSSLSREDQFEGGSIDDFVNGTHDYVGGFGHLKGRTIQVRGAETTCETVVVTSNGRITPKIGDIIFRALRIDAGLAIPTPTAEPMPPQLDEHTSVVEMAVDRYRSRELYCNGYRLPDYLPGEPIGAGASPLFTGWQTLQLRGWGQSLSTVFTMPNPQPTTVRAVRMELA